MMLTLQVGMIWRHDPQSPVADERYRTFVLGNNVSIDIGPVFEPMIHHSIIVQDTKRLFRNVIYMIWTLVCIYSASSSRSYLPDGFVETVKSQNLICPPLPKYSNADCETLLSSIPVAAIRNYSCVVKDENGSRASCTCLYLSTYLLPQVYREMDICNVRQASRWASIDHACPDSLPRLDRWTAVEP